MTTLTTFNWRAPPDVVERVVLGPPVRADDGRNVQLSLQLKGAIGASVRWVLDERGREVQRSRVVSDTYERNEKLSDDHPKKLDLPDPKSFKLVPFEASGSTPDGASDSSDAENDAP